MTFQIRNDHSVVLQPQILGDQPLYFTCSLKVVVVLVACALNVSGVGAVGDVGMVFMILCLVPFVLLFCFGVPLLQPEHWLDYGKTGHVNWPKVISMLTWNLRCCIEFSFFPLLCCTCGGFCCATPQTCLDDLVSQLVSEGGRIAFLSASNSAKMVYALVDVCLQPFGTRRVLEGLHFDKASRMNLKAP